jgi:hypothetical protein
VRDIDSTLSDVLSGKIADIALFAEMVFDSGTLHMWTGIGDITWDSKTFIGGGNLVGVSSFQETQELQAKGLELTLSGIPEEQIAVALTENTRGRAFKMWLASVQNGVVIGTPYRIFTGIMDSLGMKDTGQQATLVLKVESSVIIGQRNKVRRYTAEDQSKYYSTDTGLKGINSLIDKEVVW